MHLGAQSLGSGTLSCVETDGSSTVVLTASSYIESVGLDSSEDLYVSVGDTIYSVDQSAGTLTAEFVASGTVLDFVFDYNDDLYVESNVGEIELAPADGSGSSTFATVSGQAKLAISPDGYLVRVIPTLFRRPATKSFRCPRSESRARLERDDPSQECSCPRLLRSASTSSWPCSTLRLR